jgi:hypothetical protein
MMTQARRGRTKKVRITSFQIFTLLFLYNEESKESEKRAVIRNRNLAKRFYPGLPNPSPHISLRELALLIPDDTILSNIMSIDQMYNELKLLEVNELITAEWDREYDKDNYEFSLSTNGIIWTKRYLGQFPVLTQRDEYVENVENTKTPTEIRKWFIELKDKVIGKTQDEVADLIVNGTKKYGLSIITSLINLTNQSS